MRSLPVAAVFVPLLVLAAPKKEAAQSSDVQIGQLVLRVSEAESAQVFHIVDQLSEWSQFCHRQYGRWAAKTLKLTKLDRKLLAKHAELRNARGWGGGFEQTFYVDASIKEAVEKGLQAGVLTSDELNAERQILLHFARRVRPLLEAGIEENQRFRNRLLGEAERIAPTIKKLAVFTGTSGPLVVPVFLIPNPEKGSSGGGYNGGRLVLEIQAEPDPMPTLLHEILHAFLAHRSEDIATAVKRADGLDQQTLSEGIAYALAPGIITTASDGSDQLSEWAVREVLRGTKPADAYLRFKLIALVLRPLLRDALEGGETLTEFLPRAVDKWNQVQGRR